SGGTLSRVVRTMMASGLLRIPRRRAERMGMPAPLDFHTREMVLALPEDGNRYETVWGELLVTPSPRMRHQVVVKRLLVELELYLRRHPVGEVLASPADVSW